MISYRCRSGGSTAQGIGHTLEVDVEAWGRLRWPSASGQSWLSTLRMLDLPLPLGPVTSMLWPGFTCRESSRASSLPVGVTMLARSNTMLSSLISAEPAAMCMNTRYLYSSGNMPHRHCIHLIYFRIITYHSWWLYVLVIKPDGTSVGCLHSQFPPF